MRNRSTLAASFLLSTALVAAAGSLPALASARPGVHHKGIEISTVKTSKFGRVVSNQKGRVMYLYSKDGRKVSHCNGACAGAWPKVSSTSKPRAEDGISAKHLGRTKKGQVTYYGHPLYYFATGTKAGNTSGENVAGFFVVSPHGTAVKPKTKKPTGPSGPAEVTTGTASTDTVLTTSKGFTLYALTNPNEKTSYYCTGSCLGVWKPLLTKGAPTAAVSAMGSLLSSVNRSGVGHQVTYNGYPLYTYTGDSAAGQNNGEALFGPYYPYSTQYWYDLKPDGTFIL